MEFYYQYVNISFGANDWNMGIMEEPMIKNIFLISYFLFFCGCQSPRHLNPDNYVYYVIDVNGTEPDAEFEDRKDAKNYVEKYKEFHTYRIVKAQHYTNHN